MWKIFACKNIHNIMAHQFTAQKKKKKKTDCTYYAVSC
jgi:hypothetical protein